MFTTSKHIIIYAIHQVEKSGRIWYSWHESQPTSIKVFYSVFKKYKNSGHYILFSLLISVTWYDVWAMDNAKKLMAVPCKKVFFHCFSDPPYFTYKAT